ncbi:MAG: hypothetical protein KJ000_07955 [Pirellulaceae bacterium]|nr:hypothetical protein [Pirellulaceae bacterium]
MKQDTAQGSFVVVVIVACAAWDVGAVELPSDQLLRDLETLRRNEAIASADYWSENAVAGRQCDGARVAELLVGIARTFEPVATRDQTLDVLKRHRIIWNDYWAHHALPGRMCKGEYVANLLRAAAAAVEERELVNRYGVAPGLVATPEPIAFTLAHARAEPAKFNYVLGTQTFAPAYQFTDKPRLVETAEAILDLGATVIKFELSPRYAQGRGNVPQPLPSVRSLTDLARDEPSHRQVLEMPFAHFVLWAHTFYGGEGKWRQGFSPESRVAEYREVYDLTAYLLRTYSGSDKTFYLGHWEGDGWLRGSVAPENDAEVTPAAVQGMADWLNARQRAVDDAKRDTPHQRVQVWHYTEVNHVKLAMQGRPALVNQVLPKTTVDLVSYSAYDTGKNPELLKAALGFIEANLPPKSAIAGRRVFIGEYGFPAVYHTPAETDRLSRQVIRAGLEWGCPLVLYWELYNNEVDADGKQRGFWMIDDRGIKQPIFKTHRHLYEDARRFVEKEIARAGRPPGDAAYRIAAFEFLANP